jgi:hypothetical protein
MCCLYKIHHLEKCRWMHPSSGSWHAKSEGSSHCQQDKLLNQNSL